MVSDKIKIIRVGQVSNQGSQSGMVYDPNGLFPTVCACTHGYAMGNIIEYIDNRNGGECVDSKGNSIIRLGNIYPSGGQNGEIYHEDGISPTLSSGQGKKGNGIGSNNAPKCMVRNKNTTNEIKVVGNYMPSNHDASRIVSDEGIAPTVKENHGTVTGVKQQINYKGEMNMWKNELTKYDFLMEELRVADFFAGIGALHQSLKDLGVPVKVTSLSEIDIDATISYAASHIKNFKDLEFEYPSDEEMKKWLMDRNIGYSYEKDKSSVPRMKKDKLKLAYKANVLLNNFGDVAKINYEEMPDFDLMNFSFSCTDLSNSGKQRGMRNADGTPTRSGLYIYGMKAIRTKKPKYIMIENVKGLIQKKFIDDFYSIIDELEEIGYNCYYPTKEDKKGNVSPVCLNAKHFGIPQNRERIFVIAIRKDVDNGGFKFPQGKDYGVRLKDVLEENVEEKYYLSQEIQDRFKLNGKSDENRNELNVVGSSAPESRTIGQRDITYGINGVMSTLTATDYKQPKQIIDVKKLDGSGYTVCEQRTDEGLRFFKDNICGTIRTVDAGGDKRIIENGAIRGRYNEDGVIEQRLELRNDGVTNTLTTVEKDNIIVEHRLNKDYFIDTKGRCQEFEEKENYIQWDVSGKGYASQQDRAFYEDGHLGTIPANNAGNKMNVIENMPNEFRIRKLTPLECWRLMGFKDENFYKAKELGLSDSALYKQAGNSIVVNVLHAIFKNLFEEHII